MGSLGNENRVEMENCWAVVTEDCWVVAEEATQEVLNCVHPTLDTEEKRKDVIDYVQRLIKCSLGCEVFPYGSVPLKTYLPDGDIDLTVFSSPIMDETLARDVLALLQEEELKGNAEYDVKDPQFIDAEVKLVKCLVQNTVIDISFNQLGGLCTLCFLEQVDRLVGKNHLFKRSIILIKAWCYYESRILGAHHGLISTYALETLVLFIFHQFHSSLNGPLAVLYRFLDYYSKFDWDNYCISLNGPVCKSSLPGLLVETPEFINDNLLLSEEFLRNCTEMFSVPSRGLETDTRVFQQKHLNIVDPLKENNNLGRSVNRGNFCRIQRALSYGTRKLGNILLLPSDKVADEIKKFFRNTIESHRHNHLADLQDLGLIFGDEDACCSLTPAEFYVDDRILLKSADGDFENDSPKRVVKSISNELLSNSTNGVSSDMVSENGSFSDEAAVSKFHPFHFNKSFIENGNFRLENLGQSDLSDSGWGMECSIYQSGTDYSGGFCSGGSAISSPKTSSLESLCLDIVERDLESTAGDVEAMNPYSDLSGDYDSHIRSLLYGQCCYGFALSAPVVVSDGPSASSQRQNKKFWDTVRQSMPLRQNLFWQTKANGVLVGPPVHHSEERETSQGTGYFLNASWSFQGRRGKGRTQNKAPGSYGQFSTHSNVWVPVSSDENHPGKCKRDISAALSSCPNGLLNSSCSIEFGSPGNLPEDMLSGTSGDALLIPSVSQKAQFSKPVFGKQERAAAEHSLRLKNEDEFPPLSV